MKKKKNLSPFALMVIAALSLSACGSNQADTTATPTTEASTEQSTTSETIIATVAPPAAPAPETTEVQSESPTELKQYKIMCWGDSITAGWCQGSREHQFGGYRIYLTDLLEKNGYSENIDFVGKWSTGTGYDTDNSGTNGAAISHDYEWADSMQTDLNNGILDTYDPNIILLQIGTNDINNQTNEEADLSISTINERLETLVDGILAQMSETDMLFVASIPYMQGQSASHNMHVGKYNNFIKSMCTQKAEEGFSIRFVDVNNVVKNDQFDDDLHPNQIGYENIGKLWYEILTTYITNN